VIGETTAGRDGTAPCPGVGNPYSMAKLLGSEAK
jgi:hypothetical protein